MRQLPIRFVFLLSTYAIVCQLVCSPCKAEEKKKTDQQINEEIRKLPEAARIAQGRELFVRDWSKFKAARGDGLGPLYNAVSCVACHSDSSIGGSGKNTHNVDILSVKAPRPHPQRSSQRFKKLVKKHHPKFTPSNLSVVLHKQGLNDKGELEEYAAIRKKALFGDTNKPLSIKTPLRRYERITYELAQRNTPALLGSGLIDQVSDREIIELAERLKVRQEKLGLGISGRIAQTPSGAVGRFGWRGQIPTLHEFVLGACSNELGLNVPGHPQPNLEPPPPVSGFMRGGFGQSGAISGAIFSIPAFASNHDLTAEQCRSLTKFVASLEKPKLLNGATLAQSKRGIEGEALFNRIGCAECHVKDVGPATGLYSDLLLHDMGPKLADSVAAVPEITEEEIPPFSVGYFGGSNIVPLVKNISTNINQEWRTPPLWGLRDTAPYLHDGRASTIDEAIRLHAGEASKVIMRYRSLKQDDRNKILTFLHLLGNPAGGPASPFNFGQGQSLPGFGSGLFSVEPDGGATPPKDKAAQ